MSFELRDLLADPPPFVLGALAAVVVAVVWRLVGQLRGGRAREDVRVGLDLGPDR